MRARVIFKHCTSWLGHTVLSTGGGCQSSAHRGDGTSAASPCTHQIDQVSEMVQRQLCTHAVTETTLRCSIWVVEEERSNVSTPAVQLLFSCLSSCFDFSGKTKWGESGLWGEREACLNPRLSPAVLYVIGEGSFAWHIFPLIIWC